jgi:hypothetical protein
MTSDGTAGMRYPLRRAVLVCQVPEQTVGGRDIKRPLNADPASRQPEK